MSVKGLSRIRMVLIFGGLETEENKHEKTEKKSGRKRTIVVAH